MEILNKDQIVIVRCKGCFSTLKVDYSDIVICGVANNNSGVGCPLCKMFNLISVNGKIEDNIKIFSNLKELENEIT